MPFRYMSKIMSLLEFGGIKHERTCILNESAGYGI